MKMTYEKIYKVYDYTILWKNEVKVVNYICQLLHPQMMNNAK